MSRYGRFAGSVRQNPNPQQFHIYASPVVDDDGAVVAEKLTASDERDLQQVMFGYPLTARTLANRNNSIFTLEHRKEKLKITDKQIEEGAPKFKWHEKLFRIVYRVLSLDSRLTEKVEFLFSFVGSSIVAVSSTLVYMLKDLELKSLEQKGLDPQNQEAWKSFYFTLGLVLVALGTLTLVEILVYFWKVTTYTPTQIYNELRFDCAFNYYARHNPYMRNLNNEYNAKSGQDPDVCLSFLIDQMENDEKLLRNNVWPTVRARRFLKRFFLVKD